MKLRKVMMLAIIMMAGFMIMPNVHAEYDFSKSNFDRNIEQTGSGSEQEPYNLKLTKDTRQDIVVKNGQYLVIDLNGCTLEGYWLPTASVIEIQKGGHVTIKDSSNGGGKIKLPTTAPNSNPEASTFEDNHPVIDNKGGTLIIEGGTIISNSGWDGANRSTGIHNGENSSLIINGGAIDTETDNAWGITNLGTTVIDGGVFNQNQKLAMIMNSADLTINNGKFIAKGTEGQEAMITNDPGDEGKGNVIAKITGGDFQTQNVIYEEGNATTEISGGTYENINSIAKYLASGYEIKDGEIVKAPQSVESSEQAKEKNADTSDINLALIISALVLGVCGVVYTVKKKFY